MKGSGMAASGSLSMLVLSWIFLLSTRSAQAWMVVDCGGVTHHHPLPFSSRVVVSSTVGGSPQQQRHRSGAVRTTIRWMAATTTDDSLIEPERTGRSSMEDSATTAAKDEGSKQRRVVAIIGAGWGGLSAAHALSKQHDDDVEVIVMEASSRVGGLVRDGFTTTNSKQRPAEAGQHGFWNNYRNIYRLLETEMDPSTNFSIDTALTEYAEQGQYSPDGLEAVWPVYRDQPVPLPTGLAQAAYTRFVNLPLTDLLSAWPLVLAFADFDDSVEAWLQYDAVSFRDLCIRLGVSRRCYENAFEPMILTGLFAPGAECSAAAALGMAYFFVLQSQTSFDVQWCRGNIGQVIFDPWVKTMEKAGVKFQCNTRVTGFQFDNNNIINIKENTAAKSRITKLVCTDSDGTEIIKEVDDVIFAVGAKALNAFVRFCPELAQLDEFRGFANLRGTSVLATRLFLDSNITVPYTANACYGFDRGIGMTMFDIGALHGRDAPTVAGTPGSVIEVDYYHASTLLVKSDEDIVAKVKADLDTILGPACKAASVVDAAIVRLPDAVNWYFPGSYIDMPDLKARTVSNVYFAGDIVRTRHGSWSQEKAYVTGIQAANLLLGRPQDYGVLPIAEDEVHVKIGRTFVTGFKKLAGEAARKGLPKVPSLVDFVR
jgi:uncharacterized protein with NAD-binding domain and iron-sulfur cluster